MKIFNHKDIRFDEAKNLKNLTFASHPGWKFFVHRSLGTKGFSITELSTGNAAIQEVVTVKEAIQQVEKRLSEIAANIAFTSEGSLQSSVARAKLRILKVLPDTVFPVNKIKN